MKKFCFTVLFLSIVGLGFGQSTEVGVTEGELSVSLTGAANYKIPIAVPPGINGIVPQISLVYNSQGDNGIAGYGWNISGMSKISRIPATKFHDEISDPVDFDDLDRFALDGQRLILKSGVYGANNAEYETENFSNIKITSFGIHANGVNFGPAYFLVEYPDGSKAYYGNSSDSFSVSDWAITYWENPQGIRISYSYILSNNVLEIESIKYGSKLQVTPINEIKFIYNPRKREEHFYIGGLLCKRSTILSEVRTICNSIGFRNYALLYDTTSLEYERLIKIIEMSGDNSKYYNPTVFEYENTVDTVLMQESFTNLSVNPTPVMPEGYIIDNATEYGGNDKKILGDFGTDNKFGLITFSSNVQKRSNYILYPDIDSNTSSVVGTKIYTKSIFDEIFLVNSLTGNTSSGYKLNQNQNWCIARTDRNSNLTTFSVYSNTTEGNNPAKLEHEISYTFPMYYNHGQTNINKAVGAVKRYFSGDFNGDNITDVIVIESGLSWSTNSDEGYVPFRNVQEGDVKIESDNTSGGVYFVNLDPRATSNPVNFAGRLSGYFSINSNPRSSYFAADINGDGKTDIVVKNRNVIDIYSLNENNVFVKIATKTIPVDGNGYSQYLWQEPADYNGDGRIDYGPGLLSDGISFSPNDYLNATGFHFPNGRMMDFTNDGGTDWFSVADGQYISSVINIFPLNFKKKYYDYNLFGQNLSYNILLNKNTISKNQVVLFGNSNNGYLTKELHYLTLNKDFSKDKLLKSITYGNGVKEIISYSPLSNGNGTYIASTSSEKYPNQNIINAPEMKVVSKIEKESQNQYKRKLFSYSGAVRNLEGLGFLGFYSTVRTNWHNDTEPIISYISRNDISLRGVNTENYTVLGLHEPLIESPNPIATSIIKENVYTVTSQESLVASKSIILKPNTLIKSGSTFSAKINPEANKSINEPSSFITKSILDYEGGLLANKVFKIKNTLVKQFNGLDNTNSDTKTEYNSYNNPTKVITAVKEGNTTIQTTVTDTEYQNLESPIYIVGRPLSKVQQVTLGNEKMRTEEKYEYNTQQLLSEIKKKGDETTSEIKENRTYDTFGNITKRTLKAGQDSREFNYGYDSSGRFLTTEIDAERLLTTYLYNANGTLKSVTNSTGQTTAYEYDSWFKKIKETDYLSNKNDYNYVNSLGNTIVTKTYADGNVTEETFDELGRKVKSGSKNIMGTFTYISYLYDIHDRNYKISEPYIGGSPLQWNETKYDDYGRVTSQNFYTGKIINIDNNTPLTLKVNDGTISKTYKKDAVGNIVSVFDLPSNEIKYTYFANGELKESNYDGIKTKFLQDGWGRKKQIDDPSAGIVKYTYNDFGELITEENKNGTTTYRLTPAGRLDEKIISGLYTNSKTKYTYNETNKLLLSTKFEDFSNGTNTIQTDFTYDDKKRMSTKTEKTPFAVFAKDYKYDSFGRLSTETSTATRLGKSSAKAVLYTYKYGSFYQILDKVTNDILWQTNTLNARGQLLSARSGALNITNTYDSYGYNSQFKFDKTAPVTNVLSLNTSFNTTTGNLDSRNSNLLAWNESFKYDNFDRLTEFTGINGLKQTQAYDNKGRITQNSLGTFAYSTEKPYQNTSITLSPESLTYYTAKPSQIIDYNVFKNPVLINEKEVDKISFNYNDNNSRTAMFYGSLQDEKLLRPLRKYYSVDGTMEIKENITTGITDFVTYIGGDGYSAPIVFKSDGVASQKYLFLQRDYQNSIVAVTDQSGTVVEKRFFDAWGAITSVQDGAGNALSGLTVLDRGYTGHEHLQSVGLINMNARLYDPKLHRFLQPDNNIQDPFNPQNYNRYGYVVNNPLRYTDPSGDSIFGFVLGFLFSTYVHGGASSGEANPFKWDSNTWANALSSTTSSVASYNATTGVNSYIDNYNNKPALGASAIGAGYGDVSTFSGVSGLTGASVYGNDSNDNVINWYEPGGKVNWALALASSIGVVKGGLNSEQMYAEGIRRGVKANYELTGRNLSMFRDAPATKASLPISKVGQWAKTVGKGSFYFGLVMDGFGVWNWTENPNSPNAVHPAKAILNTYMGATGTWGSSAMAIPSTLYFGIDAFYTKSGGGWKGLAIDQESLYQDNRAINPNYQAFPGAMKF